MYMKIKNREDKAMGEKPLLSVYLHFRFKFLAITTIAFLLYVILSGSSDIGEFAKSQQFQMVGPFLLITLILYFVFRKFPVKCPTCAKIVPTKKDWLCLDCGKKQGKDRCLVDKCTHCKQVMATSFCDHCGEEFKL